MAWRARTPGQRIDRTRRRAIPSGRLKGAAEALRNTADGSPDSIRGATAESEDIGRGQVHVRVSRHTPHRGGFAGIIAAEAAADAGMRDGARRGGTLDVC